MSDAASRSAKAINLRWATWKMVLLRRCELLRARAHTETHAGARHKFIVAFFSSLFPLFQGSARNLSVWPRWCNGDVNSWKPLVGGVNLSNVHVLALLFARATRAACDFDRVCDPSALWKLTDASFFHHFSSLFEFSHSPPFSWQKLNKSFGKGTSVSLIRTCTEESF